jgi:hypothetical protein
MPDTKVAVPSLQAFLDAFSAHDVDAIMSFFTDDCVFDMPRGPAPGGRRLTGKEEVRAGIQSRVDGIPDIEYGDDRHWTCGDRGVPERTIRGTQASIAPSSHHGTRRPCPLAVTLEQLAILSRAPARVRSFSVAMRDRQPRIEAASRAERRYFFDNRSGGGLSSSRDGREGRPQWSRQYSDRNAEDAVIRIRSPPVGHRRAKRLTDLLDSIRAELRTRLDELRPLVHEYERLHAAEAALADGSPTSGKRGAQPQPGGAERVRAPAGGVVPGARVRASA